MSKSNVPNTCTDNIHYIKNQEQKITQIVSKKLYVFIELEELLNYKIKGMMHF